MLFKKKLDVSKFNNVQKYRQGLLNEILSQSEEETSMYMYYVMYSDQPSEQKN